MNTPRASHGGFAAIAAVFLVLVLAALGAFMVSFSNTQQLNSARDVQGSRAYWAARAAHKSGQKGKMKELLQRALTINPDYVPAQNYLATYGK